MNQASRNDRLERRLAYYTVAAGAGVLASGAAAAPIDANVSVTLSVPDGQDDIASIDIDGDSNPDFELEIYNDNSDGSGGYCGDVILSGEDGSGWTAYAQPITPGTQIDDTFQYTGYDVLYDSCPSPEGYFNLGERGFIGFRIPAPDVRGDDSYLYGYMDVEGQEGSLIAIIHGAWYETDPETSITVRGSVSAPQTVPVGGAVPLGLLLFAAGAAALRRRNRAQA